jgi:hypothetical protein
MCRVSSRRSIALGMLGPCPYLIAAPNYDIKTIKVVKRCANVAGNRRARTAVAETSNLESDPSRHVSCLGLDSSLSRNAVRRSPPVSALRRVSPGRQPFRLFSACTYKVIIEGIPVRSLVLGQSLCKAQDGRK